MEHVIFHHNGREYTIYDALTNDELNTIMRMNEERSRKLDALNAKSTRKYFEDTDKMVSTILRRCFRLTDGQIADLEEPERRNLAHAFVKFLAAANKLPNQ
ncbi:MAG: hypothetical protein ACRD99_01480 [Nitrososphaera sp.]